MRKRVEKWGVRGFGPFKYLQIKALGAWQDLAFLLTDFLR